MPQIFDFGPKKSATTDRNGGMREAPRMGLSSVLLVIADFLTFFKSRRHGSDSKNSD